LILLLSPKPCRQLLLFEMFGSRERLARLLGVRLTWQDSDRMTAACSYLPTALEVLVLVPAVLVV
jgi:hypothetical protein